MKLEQELDAAIESMEAAHSTIYDLYNAHTHDEYIGNKTIQDAIERGEKSLIEALNAMKLARMQVRSLP